MSRPTPAAPPPMAVLDTLPPEAFIEAMTPLFEGAPAFLSRLSEARPYRDRDALYRAARRIAHEMPREDQIELIDAHPRLGAPPGSVSALSFHEQGYDHGPVGDLAAEFERLNTEYEARFGFRYCVFVAGRPRSVLLPDFEIALSADREAELGRAIDAVVDIAADRHARLDGDTPRR